ncbi:hypothetical protein [Pseudomonas oryziphila]|uniref:Uncharacterized protein n=1 Tax=Pseudomonas oryziphila TaxID=2894079 RepID=A0ABM7CPR4_9PSED|nr:hypothetical protein [Pseudomonas oryziphila]AZL73396.1 hypothetical protein EI693_09965 [Pseudomonas oryziphila]
MTTEPLADEEQSKKYIEQLNNIYAINDPNKLKQAYKFLDLIHPVIAALATQRAPEDLAKNHHPLLMNAAIRRALEEPSDATKADLERAEVKVTQPVTSTHFKRTFAEFSNPFKDTSLSNRYLYNSEFLKAYNNSISNLLETKDLPDSTLTPIPETDHYEFIEALKIFAASKAESFLEEYRSFLYLASPGPFAGMEIYGINGIPGHYATMFTDAVHCAELLHASNKDIGFQINRSTESPDYSGTYIFSISVTPIDLPSTLKSKSFNELIDNIQNEATSTREGVVSNGQVALQVIVKREFIEDNTRRG